MRRTGIPLLDELRAFKYALQIVKPFASTGQGQLVALGLQTRIEALIKSPELNAILGEMYGYPCANLVPTEATNRHTGETRGMLTCSHMQCEFAGRAVDPDGPPPDCEHYRVPQKDLENMLF